MFQVVLVLKRGGAEVENQKELEERVRKVINEEVKPALQMDGGDIELVGVDNDGTVKVRLLGACGSCPFSVLTLKMGVEQSLKSLIPEVKQVIAV